MRHINTLLSVFLTCSTLAASPQAQAQSQDKIIPDPLSQVNQPPASLQRTAQEVRRDLTALGYEVEDGYPILWTPEACERYTIPIMGSCYGNDATSPYVIFAMKSWEDEFVEPGLVNAFGKTRRGYNATYRLDPREAIVVLAELPPPGRYTGLETWVFSNQWQTEPWNQTYYDLVNERAPDLVRYLFGTVPGNPSRVVTFSGLSNSINNVIIERQSGSAFGQMRYFIITPDRAMDRAVRTSLGLAGVPNDQVFTEPIPPRDQIAEIGQLGHDATANDFTTWMWSTKVPDNPHAAHAWLSRLPITVLRVRERPASTRPAEPFPPFVAEERSAVPEAGYQSDLQNLVRQICQRWGTSCDPVNPNPDQLRSLIDIQLDLHGTGPECRASGMNCLGDNQDASYFIAPGKVLDPGWVYAVVGTLGTATGNATYVALNLNDLSKLKGVFNVPDTQLAGSAASYAGAVNNTDKFYVHYFARNCDAIKNLTDGQCTTVTEEMVPLLGNDPVGKFSVIQRSYVRPGTARGALSSDQLRPMIIRFPQP